MNLASDSSDAARVGQRAAGEAGAGAAGDDRHARLVAGLEDRDDLRLVFGQRHRRRPRAVQRQAVALVGPRVLGGGEQRRRRQDAPQAGRGRRVEHRTVPGRRTLRSGGRGVRIAAGRLFHIAGARTAPGDRAAAPGRSRRPAATRLYSTAARFLRIRARQRLRGVPAPTARPAPNEENTHADFPPALAALRRRRRARWRCPPRRPLAQTTHEDEHLGRPELALRRRDRHLRARGREAHQRPLQGPELLLRRARRRARVDRGGAARHARPHDDVDRPGAELRARGRDPRHPVPVPRLRARARRARRPDRPGHAAASSRPRASSRWPGARTASAT